MKYRKQTPVSVNGQMEISSGDWVITENDWKRYPCKPDIFEKLYKLMVYNTKEQDLQLF